MKKVVVVDEDAFAQKQAKVVKCLQQVGRPRQWAQQIKSMASATLGQRAP